MGDDLRINKMFGAILAVCLAVLGLRELSGFISGGGGHHERHQYGSLNEWAQATFKGYHIDIAELAAEQSVVEAIYDLGGLLLAADIERGARSFRNNCASCHTIEQGGINGQGPNLYNSLGKAKQANAGFRYSGALANTEGDWSWEAMDAWLANPGKYARGTSMSFAGLKRDGERANVLAYLASHSPDAPPPPDPLPQAQPEETGEDSAIQAIAADQGATDDSSGSSASVDAGANSGIPGETGSDDSPSASGTSDETGDEIIGEDAASPA